MPQIYYPKECDYVDRTIEWGSLAHKFWWACGAGKGTLAALAEDKMGSVEFPLHYEREINGKTLKSPNQGCGGMMRVAPLAFIDEWDDHKLFEQACENAAVTHGGQNAYVATGMIALYVRYTAENCDVDNIISKTQRVMLDYLDNPLYELGVRENIYAANYAGSLLSEFNLKMIDGLPKAIDYDNKFLAVPIAAQVTYAMLYADRVDKVKDAMVLSVNHSGDSDSVGAIVGNILGARYGDEGIVREWSDKIIMKKEIEQVAAKMISVQHKPKIT